MSDTSFSQSCASSNKLFPRQIRSPVVGLLVMRSGPEDVRSDARAKPLMLPRKQAVGRISKGFPANRCLLYCSGGRIFSETVRKIAADPSCTVSESVARVLVAVIHRIVDCTSPSINHRPNDRFSFATILQSADSAKRGQRAVSPAVFRGRETRYLARVQGFSIFGRKSDDCTPRS